MKYLLLTLLLWAPPVLATPSHPIDSITGEELCLAILEELNLAVARDEMHWREAHDIHTRCLRRLGHD